MNTHKELLSECCSAKPCGEIAYDNSGRCGDCKEGCMFTEECDTSCGINADPADGFGKCTCGAELVEPTPPSQIEKAKVISNVFSLVNTLANKDTTMIGSEEYRAYHYFNALELLLRHYDPNHDIRWLEPLYEEMKKEIEALNNTK